MAIIRTERHYLSTQVAANYLLAEKSCYSLKPFDSTNYPPIAGRSTVFQFKDKEFTILNELTLLDTQVFLTLFNE